MNVIIKENPQILGKKAAKECSKILNNQIRKNGSARLLVSTGASQFELLKALVKEDVDWEKVEMFHLDEYVKLPITHKASFRKYLEERLVSKVKFLKVHYVETEGDIEKTIAELNKKVDDKEIDVGLIGIGENAHIAFNDPPADFTTKIPYIIVELDDACKKQQVREGWFEKIEDVPKQAVSMSVNQIMKCRYILSFVPYNAKANAIYKLFNNNDDVNIPATKLKEHTDITLFLDKESSCLIDVDCDYMNVTFGDENG